jgi:hypothetical protein
VLHDFVVSGFRSASLAGSTHSFTVMAADKYGNVIVAYTGTVMFTSNDHQAVLPGNYTFTAGDEGIHTFQASLRTAGSESIIVTDIKTSTLTGKQIGIVITPGAAVKLLLTPASTTETAGAAFNVTVTAKDFYGNIATSYTGTIHFTSSDKHATLPANYTFTAGNAGVQSFQVTLQTTGSQSITATDTTATGIKGTASGIQVVGLPPELLRSADEDEEPTIDVLLRDSFEPAWERADLAIAAHEDRDAIDQLFRDDRLAPLSAWRANTDGFSDGALALLCGALVVLNVREQASSSRKRESTNSPSRIEPSFSRKPLEARD